jgi:protein transport protein SEC24
MCYRVQDLPADFDYDPVQRVHLERSERPELVSSTVEYIAPQEYMVRAPQPCITIFLIDVSYDAVARGMLAAVAKTIGENLKKFAGDKRTKIGFITYDHQLHFYNLNPALTQPQMMVVPEIDDVFLPCPTDLIVNLDDSMELVKALMASLPTLHANKTSQGSCLGSAMEVARVLLGNMGGRISIFQATLPNIGKGKLPMRDDPSARGTSKEGTLLTMGTDFYKKFAVDASRAQIGCDLFIFNDTYCDLASLSQAAKFGAGMVFYYPGFKNSVPSMAEKIKKDLGHYLTKPTGLEAVLRIRCTRGIVMDVFHGHFFVRSQDLLCLPNASPDNGISFQLALEEDLPEAQPFVFFQAALLYTSGAGQRRIRVHTYALPTTNDLADVFNGIDSQAMASLLTKMAVDRALQSKLSDARDTMVNVLVETLSVYRQAFATPGSTALVVPESMRLLPLYVNAAMRHKAFSAAQNIRTDERSYAMILLKVLPLWESREYVYPRLYCLTNMTDEVGVLDADNRLPLPVLTQLSAANMMRGGLHLLYNGQELLLWVSREVPPEICSGVFGVATYADIAAGYHELPSARGKRTSSVSDSPRGRADSSASTTSMGDGETPTLARRIYNIIRGLRKVHPRHMMLRIVKEDGQDRNVFLDQLVEDRSAAKDPSYYEFLQTIQSKMR